MSSGFLKSFIILIKIILTFDYFRNFLKLPFNLLVLAKVPRYIMINIDFPHATKTRKQARLLQLLSRINSSANKDISKPMALNDKSNHQNKQILSQKHLKSVSYIIIKYSI